MQKMKRVVTVVCLIILSLLINSAIEAQNLKSSRRSEKTQIPSVKYGSVQALSDGQGVYLKWQTVSETKNVGFLIYRISDGQKELVSPKLIAGSYLTSGEEKSIGNSYDFFDASGDLNAIYVIESLDANDQKAISNAFAPEYVADLAGFSPAADRLIKESKRAEAVYEQEKLNLPRDLASEMKSNSFAADVNTQRIIAALPGVKIGVKDEGIYRVTRSQLQAAGFDVSANSNLWQLYLNGVEQSIIVGGSGDYIEFYGKGIDTLESDTQIYFLTAGAGNGKRMNTSVLRRVGSTVLAGSYNQTFVRKERSIYVNSILNGEAQNFFGTAVTTSGANIVFNLSGVDFNRATTSFEVNLQGLTTTPQLVNVTLNGHSLAQITGISNRAMRGTYQIPTEYLLEGANTLQLKSVNGTSLVESLRINYNRRHLAQQNRLSFYTQNYRGAVVEGFSSANIRVFDITHSNSPSVAANFLIKQDGSNYSVSLPSYRGRVFYAAEDSAVMSAASITLNNPSTLSTTTNNADLIIISHKDFLAKSEDWANYRRSQGATVKVVDIGDVYDEFNYGVLSAAAIRGFLQYAKENWQTAPKYVLLVGDASFDARNYQNGGDFNFVPTKLVDTIYTETGSDESLADFNDDGLAELAVGRIPARTPQQVTDMLAKVTGFELTVAQAAARGALFVSDNPDGYDFEAVNHRLALLLPSDMPKTFTTRSTPNAQTALINELNTGKFLVNYAGHGHTTVWATANFFSNAQIPQLTNASKLSVFTLLTCLNGYFIQPNSESMGEVLLKSNNGGAVSVWASTGLTTPDVQEVMATRFYTQMSAGNITRLGDLIKDAKSVINGGRDVRMSWALLGDPMLKMK
jgi:hypothetical protein